MTVYVDNMLRRYRRMLMCHMLADTDDELHAMADRIGINRKWFQKDASTPHYDVCKEKRDLAIKHGAVLVSNRELVNVIRMKRTAAMSKLEELYPQTPQGPLIKFLKVSHDGAGFIDTPENVVSYLKESDSPESYVITEVLLTQEQFDNLPEFEGF